MKTVYNLQLGSFIHIYTYVHTNGIEISMLQSMQTRVLKEERVKVPTT